MKTFLFILPFFLTLWISLCRGESNCVRGSDDKIDKWKVTSIIVEPFLMEGSSEPEPEPTAAPEPSAGDGNSTDSGNSTDTGSAPAPAKAAAPAETSTGGASDSSEPSGYSGYIVDLLDKLSEALGTPYEISLVPDKRYGKKEGDKWNGLIGQVCDGKAHIAAAPITVTVEREEAVDFTYALLDVKAVAVMQEKSKLDDPMDSLEALLNNSMQLGIHKDSPILKILAESKKDLHKRVYENMNKGGLEEDNEKGFRRVRAERNFAFIVEDTAANYVLKKPPCGLQAIKTDLYQRKYAFAVQQGSPLRDQINKVIVDWQIDGTMEQLQDKWWGADECSGCDVCRISTLLSLFFAAFSIIYLKFL